MKKYLITFIDDITKDSKEKNMLANNKKEARKIFNSMYYKPYPILSIILKEIN
ncbi:hypothetical protein [Clostridium sp.]|uniref:hypothetical protein n=1 Tax=Clostridium sp. TaxID=1506 RepID=UPI001D3188D1|nr:hypothetical protein [Clostridium sp.]MBS5307744.1 hypothetical protein [Clostridium sp.]